MTRDVRVVETDSGEVYIDINDLIISLLLEAEKLSEDKKRLAFKELAQRLSDVRDRAHKVGSKKVHVQKL